ncbi:hypothetical protein G9A89_018274 [Geosiphon pyriformis]|nr:hypothetical protein G9A89_018274 [Geosiphon pyriformis]
MPTIEVKTNVKVPNHQDFLHALSKLSAKILNKPISFIAVSLNDEASLHFGDSNEPAYIVNINSLGSFNLGQNEAFSQEYSSFFADKLGAPKDRGYLFFNDPGNENVGWKGATFA